MSSLEDVVALGDYGHEGNIQKQGNGGQSRRTFDLETVVMLCWGLFEFLEDRPQADFHSYVLRKQKCNYMNTAKNRIPLPTLGSQIRAFSFRYIIRAIIVFIYHHTNTFYI